MRHFILEKINADTPLAQLFNAYLSGLSTLDIMSTPRESMRLCQELFTTEARGAQPAISIVRQARRYYELTVLSNALNGLYWCIEQAAEQLTEFFAEYGGDLSAYAAANRRHLLNEYGGGEDADWQWNGTGDPDAGEGWEVIDRTDAASLSDYTLHRELAAYFPGSDNHGEHIGSSDPADFAPYTACVAHQTSFGLRQMFGAVAGKEVPICQQDERGQFVPVPIINQLEQEMNEDIANEALTARFDAVLKAGVALAQLYAKMPPDYLPGYRALHRGLSKLLAADVGEQPPF